jgi:hypothetical protein
MLPVFSFHPTARMSAPQYRIMNDMGHKAKKARGRQPMAAAPRFGRSASTTSDEAFV